MFFGVGFRYPDCDGGLGDVGVGVYGLSGVTGLNRFADAGLDIFLHLLLNSQTRCYSRFLVAYSLPLLCRYIDDPALSLTID